MKSLSKYQKESGAVILPIKGLDLTILDMINKNFNINMSEISKKLDKPTSTIHDHITKLSQEGYIIVKKKGREANLKISAKGKIYLLAAAKYDNENEIEDSILFTISLIELIDEDSFKPDTSFETIMESLDNIHKLLNKKQEILRERYSKGGGNYIS